MDALRSFARRVQGADTKGMTQEFMPETRYAKTVDGVHIAYQVAGDGPVDLVVVASVLGLAEIWRAGCTGIVPAEARIVQSPDRARPARHRLVRPRRPASTSSRSRTGWRTSGRSWTQIGSDRAVLLALEIGGFPVAAMFATTLPERTAGLIAYGIDGA